MGVPGFFSWVLKNYKNNKIILNKIDQKIDVLYLDANCLIHPQAFKTLENFKDWDNQDKLEKKMMRRIIAYIDFLIDYADPKECYISVDGVAPMAKMNQQRKRRFRSGDDNDLRNNIKKKHGKHVGKDWSNVQISPGTAFMENLHDEIVKYIKKRKNVKIQYSSYKTPGEGEHKILQDIKIRSKTNPNELYVIYGLDADLLFLASASRAQNIYLLRETIHLKSIPETDNTLKGDFFQDVFEEMNYVCISNMNQCINETITSIINNDDDKLIDEEIKGVNFSDDFIFICYLLGNDFLPHLPSVDIKTGGLDFLIDCYSEIYKLTRTTIIERTDNSVSINKVCFDALLKEISKFEHYYFTKRLPKYKDNWQKRRCPSNDPCDKEIWEIENMMTFVINDPIKLGEDDIDTYKYRYYNHYFGINNSEYVSDHIRDMANEYIKGIYWVTEYYFLKCPSWEWQYPYSHAPFISDLSYIYSKDKPDIKFDNKGPIDPFTQLLSILPPSCSNLLPKNYQYLLTSPKSPIIDFYPSKVELDMINKQMYYQCIPLIPCIDIDRIKGSIKKLALSKDELARNIDKGIFKNY